MTLAPLVRPDIRGVKGKPAELGAWCVAPGCISKAQQRHHCWPKSFLRGQPYEWVEVGGRVVANSVGLCVHHHDLVTIGKAAIRWNEQLELLEWFEQDASRGPLKGQGLVPAGPKPPASRAEACPVCGKPKRPKRTMTLPPRKTRTWALLVPDDAEVGAEILDTYIEDLAMLMGLDPSSPRLLRYHVLVPALEWLSQNRSQFLLDWNDAAA